MDMNDRYNARYGGTIYINRENGTEPDIHPNVTINGLVDCIHKITIAKDVFTGHDIMLLTGGHDPDRCGEERKRSSAGGPITIKEGAWIASRAIVVGPVEIGEHAVIGAGAVVVKDVPAYTVVAGNPAQVVRKLRKE